MKIKLKRVYDPAEKEDGCRILVERLWPRGIKKVDLKYHHWLKEVSPSTELRKWFSHDPVKWKKFQEKYCKELDEKPEELQVLLQEVKKGPVTLLFSSHDTEHNNAVCLKNYLEQNLKKGKTAKKK